MRKVESLFTAFCLFFAIGAIGGYTWRTYFSKPQVHGPEFKAPDTRFGNFLAAQHAIYVNDFAAATKFSANLGDTIYPVVQNTKLVADFLDGKLPQNAELLKNDKGMPVQLIYDAYLIKNNKWKDLHNRHKTDKSALAAPLRIWSAIANDWRTNTFNFIEDLPTNKSWKAFVRGQIHAELGNIKQAKQNFDSVEIDFMNINDYLYLMSFYTHHDMPEDAKYLHDEFTRRPGGMFMANYKNIPDWSVYTGYENALAFSLVQNVSHTQIMMYSDLSMLLLRFAQITAPEFAKNLDVINYYIGQFFYNNIGDYTKHFEKISKDSPFYPFAVLRISEKTGNISKLQDALDEQPLFVPAVNKLVGHHIKNGNKRAALRVVNKALDQDTLDDAGRAFFIKSRAYIYYAFGDLKSAQKDIRSASDILIADAEILSLQAKIWAQQNREIESAYEYAMQLVTQNPADVMAWDTLGCVVATREGASVALELLERVGEVSDTCSSLFLHMGDMYAEQGDYDKALDAYMRAIDLSDDGLIVVPKVERKIRKIK